MYKTVSQKMTLAGFSPIFSNVLLLDMQMCKCFAYLDIIKSLL